MNLYLKISDMMNKGNVFHIMLSLNVLLTDVFNVSLVLFWVVFTTHLSNQLRFRLELI